MHTITSFVLLVAFCTTTFAYPLSLDDIFSGFVKNANLNSPAKSGDVVKRDLFEENSDAGLKQVSLQSLIGDIEQNLFKTAASAASSVAQKQANPNSSADSNDHPVKRDVDGDSEKKVVSIEKTEEVPSTNGGPPQIRVDHIAVQPNADGLPPMVPTFQVHHTKLISATFKEPGQAPTKITISKTNIESSGTKTAATDDSKESKEDSSEKNKSGSSTAAPATGISTETTTTTKKPVKGLNNEEDNLKEQVAEIEANPVILSSRV